MQPLVPKTEDVLLILVSLGKPLIYFACRVTPRIVHPRSLREHTQAMSFLFRSHAAHPLYQLTPPSLCV